jgi:glc operon protein GlcG
VSGWGVRWGTFRHQNGPGPAPSGQGRSFLSVVFGNALRAFTFYTSHQRLARIPRADGDRRRDDQKCAAGQKPAPCRAGNDKTVDAGPLRSAFVSLPAWLIDCFCCPAAKREKPQQAWRAEGPNFADTGRFFSSKIKTAAEKTPPMREETQMKSRTLTVLALAAGLFAAGQAFAQQQPAPAAPAAPAAPPDLNAIPEKMPFNIPYGTPISMDRAQTLVKAAVDEATKRGWAMNVAVVDTNGDLIAFGRMDGAQLASISISQHKARVAARFRRPTRALEDAVQKFGFNYILTLDDVIASRGGIPLVEGGKLIGAIGCSGGTGSQDEATCTAAASTINK